MYKMCNILVMQLCDRHYVVGVVLNILCARFALSICLFLSEYNR